MLERMNAGLDMPLAASPAHTGEAGSLDAFL